MDSGQELSARRLKLTASDRNSMGPGEQRHCANDIICILARAFQNSLSLSLSLSEVTLSSPSNQYRQPGQWQEWIWRTKHQKREREREKCIDLFFIPCVTYFKWEDMKRKDRYGWMDDWNEWINEKPGSSLWQLGDSRNNPILKTKDTV